MQALGAITLDEVRERGRKRSADELEARRAAIRPQDPFTFIYTSGTTGPPKGCVLTHGNYCAIIEMISETKLFDRLICARRMSSSDSSSSSSVRNAMVGRVVLSLASSRRNSAKTWYRSIERPSPFPRVIDQTEEA